MCVCVFVIVKEVKKTFMDNYSTNLTEVQHNAILEIIDENRKRTPLFILDFRYDFELLNI